MSSTLLCSAADAYYYDTMHLPKNACEVDIHRVFMLTALRWHPEKNPSKQEEAQSRFKNVAEAYEVLSDTRMRSTYDRYGKKGLIWDFKYKPSNPGQIFEKFFEQYGGTEAMKAYIGSGTCSDDGAPADWQSTLASLSRVQKFENMLPPTVEVDPFDDDFPVTSMLKADQGSPAQSHSPKMSALESSFQRSLNLSESLSTDRQIPEGVSARQHMLNQWRESKSREGSSSSSGTFGLSSGPSSMGSSDPGSAPATPNRTPRARRGFL